MIVSVRDQWHSLWFAFTQFNRLLFFLTNQISLLPVDGPIRCFPFFTVKESYGVSLEPQTKHFHQLSRGTERYEKHGSFNHERWSRKQNCTDKQWLFERGQEEDALQDWRPSRLLRNEVIAVFASRAQSERRDCEQHPVGPTNPRDTSMKKIDSRMILD